MSLLKSMLQHIINDRTDEAEASLHKYLTNKMRVQLGTRSVNEEERRSLSDVLEDGIEDELSSNVGHSLEVAIGADDNDGHLNGGGGHGSKHKYSGSFEIFGVSKEKWNAVAKKQLEDKVATEAYRVSHWIDKVDVSVTKGAWSEDTEEGTAGKGKINVSVSITFESESEDDDNDSKY